MINLFRSNELKLQKVQNYRSIYDKPKSLIRAFTQELFLKILFKLFPKKFSSYKNKIRLIMNINARRSHLLLVSSYLRFRYPRYFILPSTQIYALHILIKFSKILEPQKIDFFLVCGSLLGAVRQESLAGKPTDIDLGIKEDEFPKLLDAIPLLKKNGAKFIRERFYNNKVASLQIEFPCMLVDISIYRKKNVEGKKVCDNVLEGDFHETPKGENFVYKFHYFTLSLDNLVPIKVYGREFLAPPNPEIYLERKYGKNWRIPDKKQFYWNKKN